MKPELQFSNQESLCNWLRMTKRGQEILDSLLPEWMITQTAAMEEELRQEVDRRLAHRASVLVVCTTDGHMEAYSKDATVHFADLLDCGQADAGSDVDYLESRLPKRYKGLQVTKPTVHYPEVRTAEQALAIREQIKVIREVLSNR